jgi:hypothetical protein
MLICEECGGTNIHVLAWVDANTNEYISESCNEEEDRWCGDCQQHVSFKNKKIKTKKKSNG